MKLSSPMMMRRTYKVFFIVVKKVKCHELQLKSIPLKILEKPIYKGQFSMKQSKRTAYFKPVFFRGKQAAQKSFFKSKEFTFENEVTKVEST